MSWTRRGRVAAARERVAAKAAGSKKWGLLLADARLVTSADVWEVGARQCPAAEASGSSKWTEPAVAKPVVARRAASHIASQSESVV